MQEHYQNPLAGAGSGDLATASSDSSMCADPSAAGSGIYFVSCGGFF
jgi:hypothetical protein